MADALPVWSVFQVDRAETTPMQEQIAAFFRRAIADGRLGPGARLPSTRSLAEQMAVARNTVSLAYERLAAEGYVEGRRGGGTRVARDLPDLTPTVPPAARAMPVERPPVRLARAARIMLDERVGTAGSGSGAIPEPLQPGRPGLDAFPGRVWARLAGRFWRETPATDFGYGDPAGHPVLRQALARYLGAFRGLSLDPDAIIVTSGAQQAIDLVARALLDPGDAVVLEEPCYPGLRGPMAATGARLVPVPVDGEGLDVAAARRAAGDARLVTVTPTHHFPLGVTLSLARRRALVDWAGAVGNDGTGAGGPWVLEDDYDGEFRYGGKPVPPLKALDGAGRVLYVGTVSKALAPALRIGFVAAPSPLAEPLVRLRGHFDRQPALDAQVILARFLDDGHMAGHLRRMRTLYRDRRDALADALEAALGPRARVERPETGINLTVDLEGGPGDRAVVEAARARGVSPAPLSGFYREAARRNGLLIGFASLPRARAGWAARMVREAIDAAGRGAAGR
ncbi:GntR family transcriptional regulator [Thalassobaculum fulvum]|uniref:GntR family transcriptional regulator n=1 Tax=Thalassobaculum fulvum TaxID=1633335 RepID=A0A918XN86_9PROT|nr:PLP-dependent aminotransferase family protein [Thalassobaculum fulvum]GHD40529.1 GntR family transcriptional regulator [Thalassobaculum fulvum]